MLRRWRNSRQDHYPVTGVRNGPVLRFEAQQDVRLWHPVLLELNGAHPAGDLAENVLFHTQIYQNLQLGSEDADGRVGPVSGPVVLQQEFVDLWPSRVASHCDKEV